MYVFVTETSLWSKNNLSPSSGRSQLQEAQINLEEALGEKSISTECAANEELEPAYDLQ